MKKIIVILFAIIFMSGIARLSFAQTTPTTVTKKAEASVETVRGKIISVDMVKNSIVVKESKTGIEKTVSVDSKVISSLKMDEEVKVTLKDGSNSAASIKKIIKKTKSTKK